ncbi:MAG: glycosyltransferase family 4 protein [Phycisphaerales bacterium]|nr:MAG: glycosyltransferase family 4 protein [Phycisphaerales bacterium]
MLKLKALFWLRPDFRMCPGGDTVQAKYTAQALSELGWKVDICSDPDIDPGVYDIVHLWHLERCHDTWLYFQKAKKSRRRIFLSPIYWPSNQTPLTGFLNKQRRAVKENLKDVMRLGMTGTKGHRRFVLASVRKGWLACREQLLNCVDLLLPNSASEAEILRQERQDDVPIAVIPNVVDTRMCDAVVKVPWEERSMILCVGHFCPRKNQLTLIKALKNTNISVVFVGGFRPARRWYYERCRREAAGQHTFMGSCSSQKVLELMGQARVHVLTSTSETPGLVNLEAGLMGCNLVLPPVAPVVDYFGDLAHYFSTYQVENIRQAIVDATNTRPAQSLESHIRRTFTLTQLKSRLSVAYHLEQTKY